MMDEASWTLECIVTTVDEAVLVVNSDSWKNSAQLDLDLLKEIGSVKDWVDSCKGITEELRVYRARSIPSDNSSHGVYYLVRSDGYEILAVSVPNTNDQETIQIMAMDALSEFDQEVLFTPPDLTSESISKSASLFNLLEVLLKTTSADQSAQITHTVFSFLQSEITIQRLYSQITCIVGANQMRKIVNQLNDKVVADTSGAEDADDSTGENRQQQAQGTTSIDEGGGGGKQQQQQGSATPPPPSTSTLGALIRFKQDHNPTLPIPYFAFENQEQFDVFFHSPKIPGTAKKLSRRQTMPYHVDVPASSRIAYRVGSVIVQAGEYLLLLGGIFENPQRASSSSTTNGWNNLTIIEKESFRSVDHELCGPPPPAQFGTGNLVLSFFGSSSDDTLAVFGGVMSLSVLTDAVVSNGKHIQPCQMSNELKILELNTLQWSHISMNDNGASPSNWPQARCYPTFVPLISTHRNNDHFEITGACLFGGLGRPERPTPLDDCWLLNANSPDNANVWKPMSINNPLPLWGATTVPCGLNKWLLCGGYTLDGVPDGMRLLSITTGSGGRTRANITNLNDLTGSNIIQTGSPRKRCFSHGVVMKCIGQTFTPVELGVLELVKTTATSKNMLFLVGGATSPDETSLWSMSIYEILSPDGVEVTAFKFIREVEPQLRPCSAYNHNPSVRLAEACCFTTLQPTPKAGARNAPVIPIFLVTGGLTVSSTRNVNAIPPDISNTQLITLHSLDPFRLEWSLTRGEMMFDGEVEGGDMSSTDRKKIDELKETRVHASPAHTRDGSRRRDFGKSTDQVTGPDEFDDEEEDIVNEPTLVDKRDVESNDIRKMFRTLDEQLRHYPSWLTTLNYTPSIFCGLGSCVPWPFTAIGSLLENSTHLTARASNISFDIGLSKSSGQLFMALSDDGKGLGYSTIHKLLKRFGKGDNIPNNVEHQKLHHYVEYGMGFKVAASRLSQACIVISRTSRCLSVALLSQRFLREIGSGITAATPACFWKLPQRDTTIPQQEHLLNQQKIFRFSPFKNVNSLAEQINLIGLHTGTRIIFFDRFSTWASTIGLSQSDGLPRIILGNQQQASHNINETGSEGLPKAIHLDTRFPMDSETKSIPSEANIDPELLSDCTLAEESYFLTRAPQDSFDPRVGLSSCQQSAGSVVYPARLTSGGAEEQGDSDMEDPSNTRAGNTFPFWTEADYSIDVCLATYMFWAVLFNTARLRCCSMLLQPAASEDTSSLKSEAASASDPFKNSLYRFLKRRLHGMVELDWLCTPADSGNDAFGLLGFINPLDTLIADSGGAKPLKYQEAGILLYYRERLIRRLFVPFPASTKLLNEAAGKQYPPSHFDGKPLFLFPCTGIIHVPDWLHPTMNKDEFVANRTPVFDEFIRRVKLLIAKYLTVCLDNARRTEWINERGKQFLEEAGRRRPLSPMLHVALLKKPESISDGHNNNA